MAAAVFKKERKKEREQSKENDKVPTWLVPLWFTGTARLHIQPAFDSRDC